MARIRLDGFRLCLHHLRHPAPVAASRAELGNILRTEWTGHVCVILFPPWYANACLYVVCDVPFGLTRLAVSCPAPDRRFDDYRLPASPLIPHNYVAAFFAAYYFFVLFGLRWRSVGYSADVVYELLWGCNISMALSVVALLSDNTLMLGTVVALVCVDQSLCWIDLIVRCTLGFWPL